MIQQPDEVACDLCDKPAQIHLVDTQSDKTYLLCAVHDNERKKHQSPNLDIRRWRIDPLANGCSKRLASPRESSNHQGFYWEMCEGQLIGGEGACRYYLSIITGVDHFALWSDEFGANLKELVVAESSEAAACFTFDCSSAQHFWPFVRLAYERHVGGDKRKRIKNWEKAIELLVNHPDWTDEEIAARVPTTLKQLARNSYYTHLRINLRRANEQSRQ